MTLHIFNPEHDIALASGLANFTAPHAGRQLRHDLGFLPALWAEDGDVVLVDDVNVAERAWQKCRHHLHGAKTPVFAESIHQYGGKVDGVDPWGWDAALRRRLHRNGLGERLLPDSEHLNGIRRLSHRHTAAQLLPLLRMDGTVGEAFECDTVEAARQLVQSQEMAVMKAPWSSSGRGLRFVNGSMTEQTDAWLRHLLERQGTVMVEPYYNKVKDFGMEFTAQTDGTVSYEGLSLFHTKNGAYTGNILATENTKRQMLSRYLPLPLLDKVRNGICQQLPGIFEGRYVGPFGVDMMVTATKDSSCLLHPCVEINLRRTMGHVALTLARLVNPSADDDIVRVMRIEFNNYYKLTVQQL